MDLLLWGLRCQIIQYSTPRRGDSYHKGHEGHEEEQVVQEKEENHLIFPLFSPLLRLIFFLVELRVSLWLKLFPLFICPGFLLRG
jgi:hypothetical protein